MALPCLAPSIWYFIGAARGLSSGHDAGEEDAGLLLSGIGWLLLAIGLVFKYFAIMSAAPDAYATEASSPATPMCIGLGVLCIALGAAISWFAWAQENE